MASDPTETRYIDILFDGPPSHQAGRFVEVENERGQSINAGTWLSPSDTEDDDGKSDGFWRLRIKTKPSLNVLARIIHKIAADHGFWPEEGRNMGEMLMLATSELAEALEEHRDGKPAHYYTFKTSRPGAWDGLDRDKMASMSADDLGALGIDKKPEGVAVELIDCIIRCLDTLQSLDVDIDALVAEKMAYNRSRPHKHGRSY